MKYKKIILTAAIVTAMATACRDDDKLPLDFAAINGSNGAFLRQLSIPSGSFNPFDLANSEFVIELEANDNQKGALLKEVRFTVDFKDNTTAVDTIETTAVVVKTVPAAQFSPGSESGLPTATITITALETLAALGLVESDVAPLDEFIFTQEIELIDGRVYGQENSSADILGGAFYGSSFTNAVPLVCTVDDALYLGDYNITLSAPSEFGVGVFEDQTITLEAGEQPYQRVFGAAYLEAFGFGDFSDGYVIQLICGQAFLVNTPTGLGCGAGSIVLGSAAGGTYNETVDNSFTVTFIEGNDMQDGGCGLSGANEVTITFTKVN
jgi:hypothetical protein